MKRTKIILVAGARPNFMKIAPLMREFKKQKKYFNAKLLHTGQHYDVKMSDVFFKELNIPKPDIYLGVGSGSHAEQTAKIMVEFEKVVLKEKPDMVLVVGDVNSTIACSMVASKLHVKVIHVEAGLRSFDRKMPEEINRVLTDSISDYLFVTEESGIENLKNEGVSRKKIHFVGNTMIDTLLYNMDKIDASRILHKLNSQKFSIRQNASTTPIHWRAYSMLTLHRPSNVDHKATMMEIFEIIKYISAKLPIIYPIHPRTRKMMEKHGLLKKFENLKNLIMVEPLGYVDFLFLVKNARFVLTDSGGIQEESTVLKVPCLTMRENTERPVTMTVGTNILVGRNKMKLFREVNNILKNRLVKGRIPKYWDGCAAQRIVKVLKASGK
ncbi:MAG: UDP-N-acetylglucosamine 2-epimerase (non-hydrolyzing) [Candidatus Omnitrophica bacterium]|nr:UDP-N-acetylglucosamine 2-epimerase (non-hydrolyzing) [Candidatus Omnitrophota bacterium]MCB9747029.1 UDP-N-acetylglucosamine 2-epimerase (non-hydrolyzing) [Candidatus Omnitrophota bacterium]